MLGFYFFFSLLLLLTLCSAFCSGSETALFSLSSLRVKAYQYSDDPKKRLIAKLLHHPRDLLVTIFMLNTLVNILIQNVVSHMSGKDAGWAWKVGVPLVITLTFGEILPKNIGMLYNESISHFVVTLIDFVYRWLSFARKTILRITYPLSRIIFFFLRKERKISEMELQHVLKASEKKGVLAAEETRMISGYLRIQQKNIREIMRSREKILFFDKDKPLSELLVLFKEKKMTRVPVCEKNIDNLLGMVSDWEFFQNQKNIKDASQLQSILWKPMYVPENVSIKKLFVNFENMKEQVAIVVDEFGGISGLITKEDLVAEIIGIHKGKDQKKLYTKMGKEIVASGKLELTEFNRIFSSSLKSECNMLTIGGWLIEILGEIPKSGVKVEKKGFLFHVLASDPNKVRRLFIRKIKGN